MTRWPECLAQGPCREQWPRGLGEPGLHWVRESDQENEGDQ